MTDFDCKANPEAAQGPAVGTLAYWQAELAACEQACAAEEKARGERSYAYESGRYRGLVQSMLIWWPKEPAAVEPEEKVV